MSCRESKELCSRPGRRTTLAAAVRNSSWESLWSLRFRGRSSWLSPLRGCAREAGNDKNSISFFRSASRRCGVVRGSNGRLCRVSPGSSGMIRVLQALSSRTRSYLLGLEPTRCSVKIKEPVRISVVWQFLQAVSHNLRFFGKFSALATSESLLDEICAAAPCSGFQAGAALEVAGPRRRLPRCPNLVPRRDSKNG